MYKRDGFLQRCSIHLDPKMTIRQTYSTVIKRIKEAIRQAMDTGDYKRVNELQAQLNYSETIKAIGKFVDRCD
jgi:hypothetical protein